MNKLSPGAPRRGDNRNSPVRGVRLLELDLQARRDAGFRQAHTAGCFTVDSVTTLPSGQPATVTASFDGTFVRFAFGIPQGQQGNTGNNGFDGSPGMQGPPGPPGEVTAAQLVSAIAGTSSNINPIATLELVISDPPTQGELTQVLAKLNELIVGLRR